MSNTTPYNDTYTWSTNNFVIMYIVILWVKKCCLSLSVAQFHRIPNKDIRIVYNRRRLWYIWYWYLVLGIDLRLLILFRFQTWRALLAGFPRFPPKPQSDSRRCSLWERQGVPQLFKSTVDQRSWGTPCLSHWIFLWHTIPPVPPPCHLSARAWDENQNFFRFFSDFAPL